jgi:hypothetical protein
MGDDRSMSDSATSGVARFIGTVTNSHEIFSLIYADDLELYELDPPLCGYRIVAAAQTSYAMHARYIGDPTPPDDPVSTSLFGTSGGEGLQIEWRPELFKGAGRAPVRALAEVGYQVLR